eukprot:GHVS01034632.1.p1 GENE.GHVS01034632.1~~GHVS01034632.1.p1  ORF type:complete len:406 (+),score=43.10 GHVS01034632.1:112-1329(+)
MEDNGAVLRKESMVEPRNNERSRCSRRTILWSQLFVVCLSLTVPEVKCTKNFCLFDLDGTLNDEYATKIMENDSMFEANLKKSTTERVGQEQQAKSAMWAKWLEAVTEHQETLDKLLSNESMVSEKLPVFVLTSGMVWDLPLKDSAPIKSRKPYLADTFGVTQDQITEFSDLMEELKMGEWTDPCQTNGEYPIKGLKIESIATKSLFGRHDPRDIYIMSPLDVYKKKEKALMKLRLLEIGLHLIGVADDIRLITVGDELEDLVLQDDQKNIFWHQKEADSFHQIYRMDQEDGIVLTEMKSFCNVGLAKFDLYKMRNELTVEGILMVQEADLEMERRSSSEYIDAVSYEKAFFTVQAIQAIELVLLEAMWIRNAIANHLSEVKGTLEKAKVRWNELSSEFPRRVGV